jgi:hypothetical protein
MSINKVHGLLRSTRLALQEFGPSMALLTLPGGYLVALTGLIYRHWPAGSAESRQHDASALDDRTDVSDASPSHE